MNEQSVETLAADQAVGGDFFPNGPATLRSDPKRERVTFEYAGNEIFKASVRVRRDGKDLPLKEAAVRLFALSKSDGWDVVTQTIRVTVIGALPGDLLFVRGVAKTSSQACVCDGVRSDEVLEGGRGLYDRRGDWMLVVDLDADVIVSGAGEGKFAIEAVGSQILFRFLPYFQARHSVSEM